MQLVEKDNIASDPRWRSLRKAVILSKFSFMFIDIYNVNAVRITVEELIRSNSLNTAARNSALQMLKWLSIISTINSENAFG